MRLASRRVILTGLLTCLVLVAGGTALLSDDETQILIENERESSYQVTAYQIAQEDRRELRFEVTTGEGRQRLVGMEALRTEANYTDVTPADPVRSDRVPTVRNGNSTKFVGDWNRSQLTVYVVESHRNELVDVHVTGCARDMALTFATVQDGGFTTTSRCVQDVHR